MPSPHPTVSLLVLFTVGKRHMSQPSAHRELILLPAYQLITVRDPDIDVTDHSASVIASARADVVASTETELFIHCAQDFIKVTTRLELWPRRPATAEPDGEWTTSPTFELVSPSGQLVMGTPTGEAVDLPLDEGPGLYGVDVLYRGRDHTVALRSSMFATHQDVLSDQAQQERELHAGTEQYRIRVWRETSLPDDWDDED